MHVPYKNGACSKNDHSTQNKPYSIISLIDGATQHQTDVVSRVQQAMFSTRGFHKPVDLTQRRKFKHDRRRKFLSVHMQLGKYTAHWSLLWWCHSGVFHQSADRNEHPTRCGSRCMRHSFCWFGFFFDFIFGAQCRCFPSTFALGHCCDF